MYKVKLIKGLSYNGAVHATKKEPFAEVKEKETADALVASGYFELVEATPDADNQGDANTDGTESGADLDKMTVPQIDAFAADRNINLEGCKNKAEKIAKIAESLSSKPDADNQGEADTDGGADYGEEE